MNRPVGVTAIAILQAIWSIIGLIGSLGILVFQGAFVEALSQNPELQQPGQDVPVEVLGGVAIFIGIITLTFSVIGLVLAWGLFTLKSWAWIITLVLQALGVVGNLFSLVSGAGPGALISIAIAAVIIYYLLRPEVRRVFGQ